MRNSATWILITTIGAAILVTIGPSRAQERADNSRRRLHSAFRNPRRQIEVTRDGWKINKQPLAVEQIEKGDPDSSRNYSTRIARELGFESRNEPRTLGDLLDYLGYSRLAANGVRQGLLSMDLEILPSNVLMHPEQLAEKSTDTGGFSVHFRSHPLAAGEILATRFFSPKTTDVSGLQNPRQYSWRKTIRLLARTDSRAERRGVTSVAGGTTWDPKDELDRKVIALLGRYCYRCHGTVAYNVFDKQSVLARIDMMIGPDSDYLQSEYMPQDRSGDLNGDRQQLINLLDQLRTANQ